MFLRTQGLKDLRAYRMKIAAYYQEKNIPVNHNELIVTTGGSEALLFAMGSIADTGDEIIIPEPFYANYNGFATASGVTIVPVISKIEDNFALPDISEFEKLITPKTKAILICNPGNPTGLPLLQTRNTNPGSDCEKNTIYFSWQTRCIENLPTTM